jgi:tryptophan synthase alpha chain
VSRIDDAFASARAEGRAAFVPYLTAGHPTMDRFLSDAKALLRHADVLEVGLPYSDPLGDGPTIQRSSEVALAAGTRTAHVLEAISTLRASSDAAIACMTYYNPIVCYGNGGEEGFVRDLAAAGADAMILPDLPPEEAEDLIGYARRYGVDTVFLVAPTSTDERLRFVTQACRGFVYAVSVTGVTGERTTASAEVPSLVERVKRATDLPVAVGFGVSNAATAKAVASVADGVVVGSALIRAVAEGDDVAPLARELAEACRRT